MILDVARSAGRAHLITMTRVLGVPELVVALLCVVANENVFVSALKKRNYRIPDDLRGEAKTCHYKFVLQTLRTCCDGYSDRKYHIARVIYANFPLFCH